MPRPAPYSIFADKLWAWFDRHKRTLPWRDLKGKDVNHLAYLILVSEVMLQQTQVSRVQTVFKKFIERFPTLGDLAKSNNAEVILAWRGMGYNSRALRLRDACRTVQNEHGGVFPREVAELLGIKGIGAYTAAAIRNFAFGIPTPCLDTNIRRILHRVFEGPERADGRFPVKDRDLMPIADRVLRIALNGPLPGPSGHPSPLGGGDGGEGWHAALMDFGSMVCTKRSPKCAACPLKDICQSAFRVPVATRGTTVKRMEPGRLVGSTFVPNRIFRGRILECLRDAPSGLTSESIGRQIAIDWNPDEHGEWLAGLLLKLEKEEFIVRVSRRFFLRD